MISKRVFLQKTLQEDRNMLYKQGTAADSLSCVSVGGTVRFISSDTQHRNFPSTMCVHLWCLLPPLTFWHRSFTF